MTGLITAILVLFAQGPTATDAPVARLWADSTTVSVGNPFWIHVEATGTHMTFPETIRAPGLTVDPINVRQSSVSPSREDRDERTTRRSFYARAVRTGTITLAPVSVQIDGTEVKSNALEIRAVSVPVEDTERNVSEVVGSGDLPKEDLVFIDMHVDQRDVYQGEPIFFRTQLWRIIYPEIDSGPYRESRIEWPTTEGFFVRDLEPRSYTADKPPWQYDVWEERMILFPTVVGEAQIGRWHWEGVALVETKRRTRRQRMYYDLDAGPIPIQVRAIPEGPETFSGAVGQFDCEVSFADEAFQQGVQTEVTVTVSGTGNPHAMGEPSWPKLRWAQLEGPERASESAFDDDSLRLHLTKDYTYALTPLARGTFTIDAVTFTYFDPDAGRFVEASDGPFEIDVKGSGEEWNPMVVADDLPRDEQDVAILAEGLRPLARLERVERAGRGRQLLNLLLFLAPAAAYAAVAGLTRNRRFRRTASPRGHAHRDVMARLEGAEDNDPVDAIHEAIASALGRRTGTDLRGATAQELVATLESCGSDAALRERVRALLETCERARYGAGGLDEDARYNLIEEAKACVVAVSADGRGAPSREER